MKPLLFLLLLMSKLTFSQTTLIPDSNFEQALLDRNIDSDGILNGEIPTSDISTLTSLIIDNLGITNLSGIEDFTDITVLSVDDNQLTSIDVSNNTNLETLSIDNNQLTSLDISNNTSLTRLTVNNNQLTNLDVSNNTNLETLSVDENQLTNIDLSNNINLERVFARNNQLTSLDISNNTSLSLLSVSNNQLTSFNIQNGANSLLSSNVRFGATGNPGLLCIQVDNVTFSETTWTIIDPQTSFSTSCATLSVTNLKLEDFIVYPNPTSGILNIDLTSNILLQNINMYNHIGQLLISTEEKIIDVSDISAGIYFIEIITSRGNTIRKFIKE